MGDIEIAFKTEYVESPKARLQFAKYHDGSTAIQVYDSVTGEPLCKATVCLSATDRPPLPGNVYVKNYAENAGVLGALLQAGIVAAPNSWVTVGHATNGVAECKLLVAL